MTFIELLAVLPPPPPRSPLPPVPPSRPPPSRPSSRPAMTYCTYCRWPSVQSRLSPTLLLPLEGLCCRLVFSHLTAYGSLALSREPGNR